MNIWFYILEYITIFSGLRLLLKSAEDNGWFGNLFLSVSGIYLIFNYHRHEDAIKMVLIIMLIWDAVMLLLIWFRRIKGDKTRIIWKRVCNSVLAIKRAAVPVFVATALCICFGVGGEKTEEPKPEEVSVTYGDEYSFAENVDTMLKLQEDEWKYLPEEERLEVLQCVAYCEARYLGIWTPLTVKVEKMDDQIGGYYSEAEHAIYVNRDCFLNNSAMDSVETICHESYHAYSYRLVELYLNADEKTRQLLIFDDIKQYAEEFSAYTSLEEDLYTYYQQKCEKDAYSYGRQSAREYYQMIEQYLEEKGRE